MAVYRCSRCSGQVDAHAHARRRPSILLDSVFSTLLTVVSYLVRRSIVSVTGPSLFRSIEEWSPTFVVDEADTALVNNDDLKEVMNSGWMRGQGAISKRRTVLPAYRLPPSWRA
jgi:hypothetical protein